jgi:hypothetical protein
MRRNPTGLAFAVPARNANVTSSYRRAQDVTGTPHHLGHLQHRGCGNWADARQPHGRLGLSCSYIDPDPGTGGVSANAKIDKPEEQSFGFALLDRAQVGHILAAEIRTHIGSSDDVNNVVAAYFSNVHPWLPMLTEPECHSRVAKIRASGQVMDDDFALLVLCMFLTSNLDAREVFGPDNSLYTKVKTILGAIESWGSHTVATLQAKVLLTVFEAGHGLPAAYASSGSNVRTAVTLGLNKNDPVHPEADSSPDEELRRAWQSTLIIDRFVSIIHGQATSFWIPTMVSQYFMSGQKMTC